VADIIRQPTKEQGYYHGATVRPVASAEPVPIAGLDALSWHELRALAKLIGVTGYAKMKRPALEAAVRAAQEATRNAGQ
jgi:hypothetical protein